MTPIGLLVAQTLVCDETIVTSESQTEVCATTSSAAPFGLGHLRDDPTKLAKAMFLV
ncbi:MAG: hypothetical protein QOH71_1678 [Blastocatellia bacterium]|nr:hypothetical protein [Blastocatellia bacterium]